MNDVDECLIQDGDNGCKEAERAIRLICDELKTSPVISQALDDMADFLVAQNTRYANSVFEPIRVFTSASVETLIRVRMNDKVARIMRGQLAGEDAFKDLLGYHILHQAFPLYQDLIAARTVPGPIVTESLKNRGLRVGMTYEEVRDNKWTECEGEDPVTRMCCTESDPCSACKFLDGALCECGHSFMLHGLKTPSNVTFCPADESCNAFSLASWPNETLDDVADDVAAHVNANVDGWTAVPSASKRLADAINMSLSGASATPIEDGSEYGAATITATEPKKEPTMTDTKKPRIDRKTWHQTDSGSATVAHLMNVFSETPPRAWYARDLYGATGTPRSDIDMGLDYLLSTATIVQHGKAKGTRYAVAGFTDWPAPLPRGKRNDSPVSSADADAAHSLDASDSGET